MRDRDRPNACVQPNHAPHDTILVQDVDGFGSLHKFKFGRAVVNAQIRTTRNTGVRVRGAVEGCAGAAGRPFREQFLHGPGLIGHAVGRRSGVLHRPFGAQHVRPFGCPHRRPEPILRDFPRPRKGPRDHLLDFWESPKAPQSVRRIGATISAAINTQAENPRWSRILAFLPAFMRDSRVLARSQAPL